MFIGQLQAEQLNTLPLRAGHGYKNYEAELLKNLFVRSFNSCE